MKILLIGEYSNVHWTLAEGLRSMGHTVCVASNGDFWKNYKRDISLTRDKTRLSGLKLLIKTWYLLTRMRGYDVVQIINPMFLELRAEKIAHIYDYLRRHNKKVFMGAFGMDAFWVKCATSRPAVFKYSDFNIGDKDIVNDYTTTQITDWQSTPKANLNKRIADDCNGIIAGMYEYYTAYEKEYSHKLTYIPFPIECDITTPLQTYNTNRKIRFFIGIQKSRSIYKGTDIMLRALEHLHKEHPDKCEILRAENVPYEQYKLMVENCDVLLDQLYGYSPGMNALLALAKGKIVVGGAEEECYQMLNEKELRPMINVVPSEEDVYNKLLWLVENREKIATLQQESLEYIRRHHLPLNVAERYLRFWNSK